MDWLESLLMAWGRHHLRALDAGLGYTKSTLANLNRTNTSWRGGEPTGALNALDFHELERAIDALPDKEKAAIVAYYAHSGCTVRRAAIILECSSPTVKKRVNLAKPKIYDHMQEQKERRT